MNKLSNLQIITNRLNLSKDKKSFSGLTGVTYNKKLNKWVSRISINGKRKHLGVFKNKEDAYLCYKNEFL